MASNGGGLDGLRWVMEKKSPGSGTRGGRKKESRFREGAGDSRGLEPAGQLS